MRDEDHATIRALAAKYDRTSSTAANVAGISHWLDQQSPDP